MDLLINKMDFTLPLDSYEGKDLVMHGQAELILKGEARKGAPGWPALHECPPSARSMWPDPMQGPTHTSRMRKPCLAQTWKAFVLGTIQPGLA